MDPDQHGYEFIFPPGSRSAFIFPGVGFRRGKFKDKTEKFKKIGNNLYFIKICKLNFFTNVFELDLDPH